MVFDRLIWKLETRKYIGIVERLICHSQTCGTHFENALLPGLSACNCYNTDHQKAKLIPFELCVSVIDHIADDKTFLSEICSRGEAIILFVGMSKEMT